MTALRLHPDDVAAIADLVAVRVLEGLRAERATVSPSGPALVDAAAVARALGVTRETVYENADRLGARRLGDGPRPRLRFDLAVAVEAWTARPARGRSEPEESPPVRAPRPARPKNSGSRTGVLPCFLVDSPESEKTGRRRANDPPPATRSRPSPHAEPTRANGPALAAADRAPRASSERSQDGA